MKGHIKYSCYPSLPRVVGSPMQRPQQALRSYTRNPRYVRLDWLPSSPLCLAAKVRP